MRQLNLNFYAKQVLFQKALSELKEVLPKMWKQNYVTLNSISLFPNQEQKEKNGDNLLHNSYNIVRLNFLTDTLLFNATNMAQICFYFKMT